MSYSKGIHSSGRPPDNDDYDSDVLADSSSDDEDDQSVDLKSKTCDLARDDDDEEYGNFLRSVFCDDDGAKSAFSFSDEEEDEEEYRPQYADSNDDDDDDDDEDDDGDDDGLIKVARKELVDLVDGCWQTIAGEPVQLVPPSSGGAVSQKGRGVKRTRATLNVDESSLNGLQSMHDIRNSDVVSIGGTTYDIDPQCNIQSASLDCGNPVPTSTGSATTNYNDIRSKGTGQQIASQSLISTLVRRIFSGEKPSAVCLDGMPVDAIRKLVARQMSMASQLLVQMLLASEDRSVCFNTCYTSLMELSNCRESALKKAALLQMNMKNLRVAAFQKISQLNSNGTNNQGGDGIDSSPAEMRLTRAVAGRQSKAQGSSARSTSLFDLPMLSDITALFETIDLSRREIKAQIAQSASHSSPAYVNNPKTSCAVDTLFRSRSEALFALKAQMQRVAPTPSSDSSPSRSVSALTRTRVWECLIPTPCYPLGGDLTAGADPSSLMGRSLFTPAEDDLLLRGIIKHGEDSWGLIRQQFLPSKEEQLLQFRFRQMTSPAAKEASKFKRYTALEKSCRGRETWTHEEDLDLLRGFHIYGDKWPLISIFFFPHRCRKQLKARWQVIQTHWERAFSGNLALITFQTELPAPSKMLLHFLKESSSSSAFSPVKSPTRMHSASSVVCVPPFGPLGVGDRQMTHPSKGVQLQPYVDLAPCADDAAVEQDTLADSDEEEGEKDLDWHLGRLTSRQSVLSQWSQTLSSTAALYCGGTKRAPSSSGARVGPSEKRTGVTAGTSLQPVPSPPAPRRPQAHFQRMQQQQQQQLGSQTTSPDKKISSSNSNSHHIDAGHTTNGRGGGKIDPSLSRNLSIAHPVDSVPPPFSSSSSYQCMSEASYGFDSLSNMTAILDNARALLDTSRRDQSRPAPPTESFRVPRGAHSSDSRVSGDGETTSLPSKDPVDGHRDQANPANHSGTRVWVGSGSGAGAGAPRGLFAAVMKDTQSV